MPLLQVTEKIPAAPSPKTGKMTPNKVKLSDGTYCTLSPSLFNSLQVGSFGECEVVSTQNGQYTNNDLKSFTPSTPQGQAPTASTNIPSQPVANTAYAKADQKDRMIAMEAAQKPAGEITHALIAAGIIKDGADALRSYQALCTAGYEMTLKAGQGNLATSADPFAED